ncbi:MAG: hypothetical protein LC797_05505 [Chloroflexi bacterium]|nr:hypothetical protein [Chloroflexota bacterium]
MNEDALIRLVDGLEDRAEGYLTLDQVERAVGGAVPDQIAAGVLLIDYRNRADGTPVTLCRLNRHHPRVAQLTAW